MCFCFKTTDDLRTRTRGPILSPVRLRTPVAPRNTPKKHRLSLFHPLLQDLFVFNDTPRIMSTYKVYLDDEATSQPHPYWPSTAVIPGFRANETSVARLLAILGSIALLVVGSALRQLDRSHARLRPMDKAAAAWFSLCAFFLVTHSLWFFFFLGLFFHLLIQQLTCVNQVDFYMLPLKVCVLYIHFPVHAMHVQANFCVSLRILSMESSVARGHEYALCRAMEGIRAIRLALPHRRRLYYKH